MNIKLGLKKEPFWHFKPINNLDEIDGLTKPGETASVSKMRSAIKYAYVDDDLFSLFLHQESRALLSGALINAYIKTQSQQARN